MWNLNLENRTAAISDDGTALTYLELKKENDELYSQIGKRCLIFSLCTNTIGSLVGYTTSINNNVVPLLLAAEIDRQLLHELIDNYKPDFIWVPDNQSDKIEGCKPIYSRWNYSLFKTSYDGEYQLYDDLCLLLTTSGSTGSPKLVRQSYNNVLANANSICEYLELDDTERPITTLPMNYTYGLSIINSHLLAGATILLTEYGLMQKQFWSFFKEQEATSFGGVPYTYEMLDKLRFTRMDLPSLRTMTQAGGKLLPDLHKKFAEYAEKNCKRFYVMYGQCEATARMSYLPYEKSLEKYGSMGIAIPGGKFSLIDVDGSDIKRPNITGELVYEGPNVTLGYAECGEDLAKGDERHGRLITGDMAECDKDGFYFIVGRKKRFLKIFGNRVNLDEIDRLIQSQFNNIECASAGVDDKMYVFVTDDSYGDDIKKFLSEKTKLNSSAFSIKKIDIIPRNESGKLQYKELVKYYD